AVRTGGRKTCSIQRTHVTVQLSALLSGKRAPSVRERRTLEAADNDSLSSSTGPGARICWAFGVRRAACGPGTALASWCGQEHAWLRLVNDCGTWCTLS